MKKIIGTVVTLVVALSLVSCVSPEEGKGSSYERFQGWGVYSVTTDMETGCKYLNVQGSTNGGYSIHILYKSDGTVDCPNAEREGTNNE